MKKLTFTVATTLLMSAMNLAIAAQSPSSFTINAEPMFWWAGMENSQLELLIEGDNVAALTPKLSQQQGITLLKTERSISPNHLFVTLDLHQAQPQTLTIDFYELKKPKKPAVATLTYQLKPRKSGSKQRQGFSNKDVIYLITPDRFANGNPDNDNHPTMLEKVDRSDKDGRHGGDIQGIVEALPYLADLGVTQLWINPLLENNQEKYSYHGYSITNFYQIDPRFGSNQDYVNLVQQANKLGIGVIKDVVVNHMGSGHPWMKNFPSATWVNGQASLQQQLPLDFTNHRRTTVQDPYAASTDTQAFSDGWFTDTMPDMNQTDPHFATYLIQNSIWWVEYAGLSGIREDTYSYADKAFLTQWSKAIMTEYPKFNIVGEEWSPNPITVSYWQAGKHNKDGYVSHVPSMMDFPLYEKLIASLTQVEGWDTGLVNLYEMLANDVVYAEPTQLVLFEGNHDTNRLYSLMNEDLALFKMAMAYVLTSNRIPQIFYGTEVLMTSPTKDRNDGLVRSDFPGGWQGDSQNAITGDNLSPAQIEAQHFIKTLLNYRKHSDAIINGTLSHYAPQDGVYVQFRQAGDETLMSIYNKNSAPVNLALSRFAEHIGKHTQASNILEHTEFDLNDSITLIKKGVTLLKLSTLKLSIHKP
jgi:neopullulanase